MNNEAIYEAAVEAGYAAVQAAVKNNEIVPMIVNEHASPLSDASPVTKSWFVADGPCGFASIIIKPANSAFAKFLVQKGIARKHYQGGVSIYVSQFNQSLQKKESYAYAFSNVLQEFGIKSYVDSRMD